MKSFLKGSYFCLAIVAFAASSCWQYQAVETISKTQHVTGQDTLLNYLITPYRIQMEGEMNTVIGELTTDLFKAKPESSLGNLICNILLETSGNAFSRRADFAVYNYGGLRKDYLAAGPLSKGEIFEVLPFDNNIVLLTLDGNTTTRLLDKIAIEGGWPVAGISMTIRNGKAQNVLVNGVPFDSTSSYFVVMNDYMANGGDGMGFLSEMPSENLGITVRNIVLNYIDQQTKNQITIGAQTDNRIVVGE